MTTCAQYRTQAWDAQESGEYELAAKLYQLALDAYPNGMGNLRATEINGLQMRVSFCREMAVDMQSRKTAPDGF